MGLDLQNQPQQTMNLYLQSRPTILDRAWEEVRNVSKRSVDFCLKEDEDVPYVTFPSFSSEDFRHREQNIQNEETFSACLKGSYDKPALVHKGAFNRFLRILESSDFKAKMQGLNAQTIIFVGHSMGGAVATLATLWFLQKKARHMSYFCVTFGSPLVGNAILGEAIRREDWTGNFFHVVSKYDIVPRVFLAPFESIAEPLNELVPDWWRTLATDYVAVTHPSTPSFLEKVLQCTSTIADNYPRESGLTSPYRPFGTFIFCSTQGAARIDDSGAVLNMLHFTMQEMPFDQLARTCASDHTGYGQMLKFITNDVLNLTPNANFARDSSERGIELQLEAMGIGAQNRRAYRVLKEAREKKNEQDTNMEELNNDLREIQRHMEEVKSYKAQCKTGYFDSFKQNSGNSEDHLNMVLEFLATFWKKCVELEKKRALPSYFRWQDKWINVATEYRRLVEPLDIARYYRTRKNTKSYLSDEVRLHHHRVLQKWMEEKDKTRTDRDKEDRTKFASLTLDSCFWARLEEASQALTSLQQEPDQNQVMNVLLLESREFEKYIWDMIRDKSISEEVFLKESSFMIWWERYSKYLQRRFPQLTEKSPLFSFMTWREQNSG